MMVIILLQRVAAMRWQWSTSPKVAEKLSVTSMGLFIGEQSSYLHHADVGEDDEDEGNDDDDDELVDDKADDLHQVQLLP